MRRGYEGFSRVKLEFGFKHPECRRCPEEFTSGLSLQILKSPEQIVQSLGGSNSWDLVSCG